MAEQTADDDLHAAVLMHDGHREPRPPARRTDTSNTWELPRLLLGDHPRRFALLSGGVEAGLRERPS